MTIEHARATYAIDRFRPLDRYVGGLADEPPRTSWHATISAGYLDTSRDPPIPRASRKADARWIHLSPDDRERAPGLVRALEAGNYRELEVAVAWDDPAAFLQQHFEKRSATRLEMFGDERQITEIAVREVRQNNRTVLVPEPRRIYQAGTEEYKAKARECAVSVSFCFCLARWREGANGPEPSIYFPDGLGQYRLRFTSRHSLREIHGALVQLASLTGGRLAGLPLRLSLDFREVADPTGTRREVGVWTLRFMPPESLELTPRMWRELAGQALAEGDYLRLPVPVEETLEDAVATTDVDLDEPTPRQMSAIRTGPPCDQPFYQRAWFHRVHGTLLDNDEARHRFLWTYTDGRTDSLTEFLATATEYEAAEMLAAAATAIMRAQPAEATAATARRYKEIFGEDDGPTVIKNAAGASVDTATGEVLEESEPVADPPEVTVDSLLGQKLAELVERAAQADVPFDDCRIGLPAAHEQVVRAIEKLEDRLESKRRTTTQTEPLL